MYFLEVDVCGTLKPVFGIINFIINVIMIGVPILLIILGMIDLGKAVVSSKDDEIKKATKSFGRRFLYAVGVFAVAWAVPYLFTLVANATGDTVNPNEANWQKCWTQIRNS